MRQTLSTLNTMYQYQRQYTQETPLLLSPILSELIKGNVLIKAESLQITGAFKFRGALSRLEALSSDEKNRGVVAYSSGNFARGLATAGKLLGVNINLVMPADAPDNKINSARAQGAVITLCHESLPSREEAASNLAAKLAKEHHYTLLHPFDDPLIIQGQASVCLELMHQLDAKQQHIDTLLCPTGGGSLVAGSKLTLEASNKNTTLYAIEPEGYNGMELSINCGQLTRSEGGVMSSCDALQSRSPGKYNFETIQRNNIKALSISEEYVQKAVQLAFTELNLVLECSGAIGIAAILQYPNKFQNQNVGVIATGGNIDPALFCTIVECVNDPANCAGDPVTS